MKNLEINITEIRNEISKQLKLSKEFDEKEIEKIKDFNAGIRTALDIIDKAILEAIKAADFTSKTKISLKEIQETIEKMKNNKIILMNPEDAEVIIKELPEFKNKIKTHKGIECGMMILIPEDKMKI